MNDQELLKNMQDLFPDFELNLTEHGSLFGYKQANVREVRHVKDLYRIGSRSIYISGDMYLNHPTIENFLYAIISTKAQIRFYRCKNWSDVELFKGFTSGKTREELFENIKQTFPNIKEEF